MTALIDEPDLDPDAIVDEIHANLDILTVEEIRQRLNPLLHGMLQVSRPFDEMFLYRGRLLSGEFEKSKGITQADLMYPPPAKASIGRVNRSGQPMFYCSISKDTLFFELNDLRPESELILTNWQLTKRVLLNHIGYTQAIFDELGATRECPVWSPLVRGAPGERGSASVPPVFLEALQQDARSDLAARRVFSKLFMRRISRSDRAHYKVTAAIADLHLSKIDWHGAEHAEEFPAGFDGLMYPSIGMWGNGDNVAMLPESADTNLKFLKAAHMRVDRLEQHADGSAIVEWIGLDCATEFDADGKLKWLGRVQKWPARPGIVFERFPGPYPDGDYDVTGDGDLSHLYASDERTKAEVRLE